MNNYISILTNYSFEIFIFLIISYFFSKDLFFNSQSKERKLKYKNIYNSKDKNKNKITKIINDKLSEEFSIKFINKHKLKDSLTEFMIYSVSNISYLSYLFLIIKSIYHKKFNKWIWYLKQRHQVSNALESSLNNIYYFEYVRENNLMRQNIGLKDLSCFKLNGINGNNKVILGNSQNNLEEIIYFYLDEMYKLEKYRNIYLN